MISPTLATQHTDTTMKQPDNRSETEAQSRWTTLCQRDDLVPGSGVAAWLEQNGQSCQIALFTLPPHQDNEALTVYAIDHHDPISGANVIARGLLGDHAGEPLVISPLYKQRYRLSDGQCLEDGTLSLRVWPVRIEGNLVQVQC